MPDDPRAGMRASDEIAVIRPPIALDPGSDAGLDVGGDAELDAGRDPGPGAGHDASSDPGPGAGAAPGSGAHPADDAGVPASIPLSAHDAITVPVAFPPPAAPAAPEVPGPTRPHDEPSSGTATAADELESGWDLGDEDPTAGSDKPEAPEVTTPSSSEMAGDGAVEGDGIDTGWD
jgi:hypothetical protein